MDREALIPRLRLPGLDGKRHALTAFRGQVLIVNFWSAECPWVRRTDAMLLEWMQTWGRRAALVCVAANAGERDARLAEVVQERGIPWLLLDRKQRAVAAFGATNTPHAFVFNQTGRLAYQGALDDVTFRQREPTRFYLHEAVEALLAGGQPPLSEIPPYGCTIARI